MDLLVMRERPRRGIRNSGYDVSPSHPTLFQTWEAYSNKSVCGVNDESSTPGSIITN